MSCPDGKAKEVNDAQGSTSVPEKSYQQKFDERNARLQTLLREAVPPVMAEIQSGERPISPQRMMAISDLLGEKGEAFLYKMKDTPRVVSGVVEGIAALAVLAQGGVTIFGLHFEAGKPVLSQAEYENGTDGETGQESGG